MMYSLAKALRVLARDAVGEAARQGPHDAILYGIEPRKIALLCPPGGQGQARGLGTASEVGFGGIARRIERHYRRYRQRGEASSGMEEWLDKVMVEHVCPDCNGARLRATRLLFTVAGKTIHEVGQLHFDELHAFLGSVKPTGRGADAGRQVLQRDPRPAAAPARHRPRLPQPQPPLGHAVRRRVAAHPPLHPDRLGPDGHALRARRAEHRPAPQGQRQDDRHARKPARHRQHRHRRRARRGHHPRRRPPGGDGPRPGRPRRARSWCRGALDDMLACKASPTGQFLSGRRAIALPAPPPHGQRQAPGGRGARGRTT